MANGLLNNLVAYYKFDEGAIASDAIDASANALTLTRTGSPGIGTGLLNGFRHTASGLRFALVDPDFVFGDQDVTFLGFVRPQSVTGSQGIMSRYDTTANARSYSIRLNVTAFQFVISANGTSATVLPFTGLVAAINTWYFVCIRYTAATDLAEISVTPVTEGTVRAFQTNTIVGGFFAGGTMPFAFGCEFLAGNAGNPFNGDLDEWGIYAGVLTNTQVSQFYNAGVPLGFPNFDTGGGTAQTLAGSSAGVSANSAALALSKPVAGSSVGIGTNSAALGLGKPLAGSSAGISTNTASLQVQPPGQKMLAGTSAGISSNSASLSVTSLVPKTLAGSSAGVSTSTANLSVTRGPVRLAGSSAGIATASGSLSVKRIVIPPVSPPASTPSGPRTVLSGRDAFKKMSKSNMILPPPIWPAFPKEVIAKFPSLAKPIAEYDEKAKDFFRQVQESQR